MLTHLLQYLYVYICPLFYEYGGSWVYGKLAFHLAGLLIMLVSFWFIGRLVRR